MGLQTAPGYLGSGSFQHPANLDRDILRRFSGKKSGVFGSTDFVVAPTTGLNVTVTGGAVSILGTDTPTTQGHYFAWSDAIQTIACVPAHASLKRIDALVLRVVDAAYSGGFTQEAKWEWVSGVAASSPTAPTDGDITAVYRPGSWIRIANVQINNGDTVVDPSRIFDTRTWTTNANGLIYAATSAGRTAITNKDVGDKCYQLDTKIIWEWDGTYWIPPVGTSVAKLRRTLTASQASGVVVGLDAEDWDLLGGHDNVTNNSRYTIQVPGKYEIQVTGHHAVIADTSAVLVSFKKNGSAIGLGGITADNSSASAGTNLTAIETFQLALNDYMEFTIGNAPGSAAGDTSGSFMCVTYKGP